MSMTSMTSFASLRNMSLQAASGQIWEEINQTGRFILFHGSLVISIIFKLVFSEVGTKLRKYWGSS